MTVTKLRGGPWVPRHTERNKKPEGRKKWCAKNTSEKMPNWGRNLPCGFQFFRSTFKKKKKTGKEKKSKNWFDKDQDRAELDTFILNYG